MTREEKLARIQELQSELHDLQQTLEDDEADAREAQWPPKKFYWMYHITTGTILGGFGSITSLLFNILGSVITGKHPFELIRTYLTFPMGQAAFNTDSDVTLIIGVILYIVTGSFLGILFEVVMARYFKNSSKQTRFIVATVVGLVIWLVNFYGILSWLQPMLFNGSWILTMIPFWVAAITHLVFAWTMLLIGEWGHFEATDYKRQAMVRLGEK